MKKAASLIVLLAWLLCRANWGGAVESTPFFEESDDMLFAFPGAVPPIDTAEPPIESLGATLGNCNLDIWVAAPFTTSDSRLSALDRLRAFPNILSDAKSTLESALAGAGYVAPGFNLSVLSTSGVVTQATPTDFTTAAQGKIFYDSRNPQHFAAARSFAQRFKTPTNAILILVDGIIENGRISACGVTYMDIGLVILSADFSAPPCLRPQETLAHEIGHLFGIGHDTSVSTNLMWPNSDSRTGASMVPQQARAFISNLCGATAFVSRGVNPYLVAFPDYTCGNGKYEVDSLFAEECEGATIGNRCLEDPFNFSPNKVCKKLNQSSGEPTNKCGCEIPVGGNPRRGQGGGISIDVYSPGTGGPLNRKPQIADLPSPQGPGSPTVIRPPKPPPTPSPSPTPEAEAIPVTPPSVAPQCCDPLLFKSTSACGLGPDGEPHCTYTRCVHHASCANSLGGIIEIVSTP